MARCRAVWRLGVCLWLGAWPACADYVPLITVRGEAPTFSPDGRMLLAATTVKTVTVVDLEQRRPVRQVGSPAVFSPDARWLAASQWYPVDRRSTVVYACANWWSTPRLEGGAIGFSADSREVRLERSVGWFEGEETRVVLPALDRLGRPLHAGWSAKPGLWQTIVPLNRPNHLTSGDGVYRASWRLVDMGAITVHHETTVTLDGGTRALGSVLGRQVGFALGRLFTTEGVFALPSLDRVDMGKAELVTASQDGRICVLRRQPEGIVEVWGDGPPACRYALSQRCPARCVAHLLDNARVLALGDGGHANLHDVTDGRRLFEVAAVEQVVDDSAHHQFAVQTAPRRWTVWRWRD